jgi:hypothetical protein
VPSREAEGEDSSLDVAPFTSQEAGATSRDEFGLGEVDFGPAVPEETTDEAFGGFPDAPAPVDAIESGKGPVEEEFFAVSSSEEVVFGEVSPEAFASAVQAPEPTQRGGAGESPDITFEFEDETPDEVVLPSGGEKDVETFDFGEIDFGIEDSVAAGSQEETPAQRSLVSAEMAPAVPAGAETTAAAEPVPPVAVPFGEDELPPLTISSRRRGQSFLPAAVITISVVVIIALAGAGFYFFKEGTGAFDKLGIGFLAGWLGVESREEGGIGLDKVRGLYLANAEAGEVFVIRGETVNNFRKSRASIQVRGALLGPSGQALVQKVAYCGNVLSDEQIKALPIAQIDAAMNNQFGDSLANLGIESGKRIPFVIVLAKVPKEAVDYSVEVVGSTVASQ